MATYELWLTNDEGTRIADSRGHTMLDNIVEMSATRVVNGIGTLVVSLPPTFDTALLKPDYMIQVWRKPEGGALSLFRPYFIRKWRFATQGADESIVVTGKDPNELLRRRIVAGYAGGTVAEKEDYADDMMKEIVTQAFADGVAPEVTEGTRVLTNFSVAADLSAGPIIAGSFPWKKLLTKSGSGLLPALSKASLAAETEVFFDVAVASVSSTSISFQFRTYTGQPGQDVSSRVVFDQERGNLKGPFLEYDYTAEVNYIYALGQGQKSNREIQQVADATRYNASKWGRIEDTAEARAQS